MRHAHGRRRQLPDVVHLRDGNGIPFAEGSWRFRSNGTDFALAFNHVPGLSQELIDGWKATTAWYLSQQSPAYAQTLHIISVDFFRHAVEHSGDVITITTSHVLGYVSTLPVGLEYKASRLRTFLRKWIRLGQPGIAAESVEMLEQMRFATQPSGEAVLTHDPRTGAFSDTEFEGIVSGLNRSFGRGDLSQEEFVLGWLLVATGARPSELAALKLRDFHHLEAADGTRVYWLDLPQAKKGTLIRERFAKQELAAQIGELVEAYIAVAARKDGGSAEEIADLPFFPGLGGGAGLDGHATRALLTKRLQNALASIGVMSERTEEELEVDARRFRYTLATRAAAEGASVYQIAELLGHGTILTAKTYVEARPKTLERIDRALALQLAPIAQAFAGVLVEREKDPRLADPTRFIIDPEVTDDVIGSCGKFGFCGLAAPIACYTCNRFTPWLDAPHEEVLDKLLQDRERQLASHGDRKIAASRDRTILAVAEVVRLCAERRGSTMEAQQ